MRAGWATDNYLTPVWAAGLASDDVPAGSRLVQRNYSLNWSFVSGAPVEQRGVTIQLDGGSPWYWWGFDCSNLTPAGDYTGDLRLRVRYPNGQFICGGFLFASFLAGPIWPVQGFAGGGILSLDLQLVNVVAGANSCLGDLRLRGYKVVKV